MLAWSTATSKMTSLASSPSPLHQVSGGAPTSGATAGDTCKHEGASTMRNQATSSHVQWDEYTVSAVAWALQFTPSGYLHRPRQSRREAASAPYATRDRGPNSSPQLDRLRIHRTFT